MLVDPNAYSPGDLQPNDDWFASQGGDSPVMGTPSGELPSGYSQSEVDDWLTRNQTDSGRMMSALNDKGVNAASSYTGSMPDVPAAKMYSLSELGLQAPSFNYTPFAEKFQAPTAESIQTMPGYQARLDNAQKMIERSASAKGTLLTPGTVQRLEQAGGDIASEAYGSEYDRRMNEFLGRYNIDNSNQMNTFNTGQTARMNDFSVKSFYDNLAEQQRNNTFGMQKSNVNDAFNMGRANRADDRSDKLDDFNIWNTLDSNYYSRLFGMAGMGQQAGAQQQAANQWYGNTGTDLITGGGNAQAAGTVGSANAWGQTLAGVGSDLTMSGLMRQRQTQNGGTPRYTPDQMGFTIQ